MKIVLKTLTIIFIILSIIQTSSIVYASDTSGKMEEEIVEKIIISEKTEDKTEDKTGDKTEGKTEDKTQDKTGEEESEDDGTDDSSATATARGFDDIIKDAQDFVKPKDGEKLPIDQAALKGPSDLISNILLGIAVLVSLISITVLGINFVLQSAEGKAQIKEAIIPLIIGMVVSFGAFGIWQAVVSLFRALE